MRKQLPGQQGQGNPDPDRSAAAESRDTGGEYGVLGKETFSLSGDKNKQWGEKEKAGEGQVCLGSHKCDGESQSQQMSVLLKASYLKGLLFILAISNY